MTEPDLQNDLARLHAPEPQKEKQEQAVKLAVEAFDQKKIKLFQGSGSSYRPTSISQTINDARRFIMKKRYVVSGMTGAVAVCALVAVLGAPFFEGQMQALVVRDDSAAKTQAARQDGLKLDGTTQTWKDTSSNITNSTSSLPFSGIFEGDKNKEEKRAQANTLSLDSTSVFDGGGPSLPPAPKKTESMRSADMLAPQYKKAVEEQNRQRVEDAMKTGQSAIIAATNTRKDKGLIAPEPSSSIPSQLPATAGAAMSIPSPMPEPIVADQKKPDAYQDFGRDMFERFQENTVTQVAEAPVSTFSIDVDTSSYSWMRRMLNNGTLPQKNAVRIEELVNYFDYHYPVADDKDRPFKPTVTVFDCPWKQGDKIVHIGIKGFDVVPTAKPKSNLVFLIDVSGSMDSPDKLPLLKNSLKMLVDTLNPDDTVGIVVYAGSAGTVLEPTKVADKQSILSALERLSAGGSTAGAEGIRQAYALAERNLDKNGVNRVILATDGDFNVGITDRNELKSFIERERDSGVFLSVLGFGEGNYNDSMMQTLAQNGNGTAAYIDTLSEARKVLVQEASSTLFTIAKDVKIQMEFNPATVKEYRLIGYETRHLNREDFNNDKVDAGEIGSGHAVTAVYEITPAGVQPMVDDLRYAEKAAKPESLAKSVDTDKAATTPSNGELGFLKIRYKLPTEDTSKLIERAITPSDDVKFENASDDARFATAVAGFGQLLKQSKFTGTLTYQQVIDMANAARGKDEFGYRSEFVNLVRLAQSAAKMPQQPQ